MSTKSNSVSLLELAASSELRECVIALVGSGATNNEPWVTADSFVFLMISKKDYKTLTHVQPNQKIFLKIIIK